LYDPEGTYIKKWCPELASVPADYIHDPWNMPKDMQLKAGLRIGEHVKGLLYYPAPIPCPKYTSEEAAKKMKRTDKKRAKTTEPKAKR
jgi:deoxyribodipyrimidine photo-lyase